MIHQIGRELEAKLLAKGCPFKVVDREAFKPAAHRNVVVIDETGDTYVSPRSQSRNAKRYFDCLTGASLTVFAKSSKPGALEFEHRRVARKVVDLLLVALRTIRAERNSGGLTIGAGQFVPIEDLATSEVIGGAVYVLPFTFERGVLDVTYAGAAADEFTFAGYAMSGSPTLTFAAADDSITRSAGSWITDEFEAGMTIRVTGSASNNVEGVIATVSALAITLTATALSDEGPVSGCTVEAGGTVTTTTVDDPDDDTPAETV